MSYNINKARQAGISDEEIVQELTKGAPKYNVKGALESGLSLDEIAETINKGQPKSYIQGIKEYTTGIVPAIKSIDSNVTNQMFTNVIQPTTTANVLGLKKPSIVESIVSSPERAARFTLGTLGAGADVLGGGLNIGLQGINAVAGGIPGNLVNAYMNSPISQSLQNTGGKLASTDIGKSLYNIMTPADPATRANLNATLSGLKGATTFTGPGFAKTITGKATYPIAKGTNKIAGKLAEEFSGTPEDALRTATTKTGRQSLKDAYGTQVQIGNELIDKIDNAWDVMPKSKEIKQALRASPDVDATPLINKLAESIPDATTSEMKAVVSKLNTKSDELFSLVDANGKIPAEKLFKFRQEIDDIIGDSWGKESGKYVSGLKDLRHEIKVQLVKTAQGTPYEATMKDMATKLDALEKIKMLVGKSEATRELRAESFIRNINNLGKAKNREWLQNFETIFGGDISTKAKLAQLAEKIGPEGVAGWAPNWTTGKSLLSKGIGVTVGSPKIATRVTLPMLQNLEKLTGNMSRLSFEPSTTLGANITPAYLSDYMKRKNKGAK